jgi:hypothetical protein
MLIDLHKTFSFQEDKDVYQVGYVFEKDVSERSGSRQGDICLTITFSKNKGEKITDKTNKASSILSQSNEKIENEIRVKVLSYN